MVDFFFVDVDGTDSESGGVIAKDKTYPVGWTVLYPVPGFATSVAQIMRWYWSMGSDIMVATSRLGIPTSSDSWEILHIFARRPCLRPSVIQNFVMQVPNNILQNREEIIYQTQYNIPWGPIRSNRIL